MEQYTDDERVEDLKKWWHENGVSIIVGIALGVAAIFGWRYWISHRDAQAERASLAYDRFIQAVEKPDAETARHYVEEGYLWNSGNFIVRASKRRTNRNTREWV